MIHIVDELQGDVIVGSDGEIYPKSDFVDGSNNIVDRPEPARGLPEAPAMAESQRLSAITEARKAVSDELWYDTYMQVANGGGYPDNMSIVRELIRRGLTPPDGVLDVPQ